MKIRAVSLCGYICLGLVSISYGDERLFYSWMKNGETKIYTCDVNAKCGVIFSDKDINPKIFPGVVLVPSQKKAYAAIVDRKDEMRGIYELTLDGSNRIKKIVNLNAGEEIGPIVFSATGEKVAYIVRRENVDSEGEGTNYISLKLNIHSTSDGRLLMSVNTEKLFGDSLIHYFFGSVDDDIRVKTDSLIENTESGSKWDTSVWRLDDKGSFHKLALKLDSLDNIVGQFQNGDFLVELFGTLNYLEAVNDNGVIAHKWELKNPKNSYEFSLSRDESRLAARTIKDEIWIVDLKTGHERLLTKFTLDPFTWKESVRLLGWGYSTS